MRTPKQDEGRRSRPTETPTLHQLCAQTDIPRVLERGRLWEKARCENLGTTKAVSRRSARVGEQRIKTSIQAEEGAGTAEEEKDLLDAVTSRDLGWPLTLANNNP